MTWLLNSLARLTQGPFLLGVADGYEQHPLEYGLTWQDSPHNNLTYDHGANVGEALYHLLHN